MTQDGNRHKDHQWSAIPSNRIKLGSAPREPWSLQALKVLFTKERYWSMKAFFMKKVYTTRGIKSAYSSNQLFNKVANVLLENKILLWDLDRKLWWLNIKKKMLHITFSMPLHSSLMKKYTTYMNTSVWLVLKTICA